MTHNQMLPRRSFRTRRAFTLMEMLVVVAIIVMLAGLGGFFYMQQLDKSKVNLARAHIKTTLTQGCEVYKVDHGSFPGNLTALLVQDEQGGPYLKTADALKDPWGKPYQYNPQGPKNAGRQPDIWSDGSGVEIGNW
jgi:general secretion pathway protein G